MFLAAILAGIISSVTVLIGGWILYAVIKRRFQRFLVDILTPPDAEHPSKLAETVNLAAIVFAKHLVQNLKATLMGMSSVDSRAESKETLSGNPVLSMLAGVLPKKLVNTIVKNPALVDLVMGYFSKGKIENNGNGHKDPQLAFPINGGKM